MSSCQSRIFGAEFTMKEIEETARSKRLLSMEIEFNRDCSFKCVYCYVQDDSKGRKVLSTEESRDVLMQARKLGVRKIIVLGGEPMIYPHIIEMLRFIREQGMEIEIFTNGTNMTTDNARILCELGIVVALKMNTRDEKLQDILCGKKGAYKIIQEAYTNLRNAGYPHITPMAISTIICSHNVDDLVDMWRWMRKENIAPYYEMITPQGNACGNSFLDISPERIQKLFHDIAEMDKNEFDGTWSVQPPLVGGRCMRHQFSCAVTAYGDVFPCIGVTIPVGNTREKRLADIIKGSEVIDELRNFKETIKGPCSDCESRSECYGCRGTAYQSTGDYLASDPTCWKNADRKNEILSLPAKIDEFVPHKKPMLAVDRLMELNEKRSVSEMLITADSIFVREDGRLDEVSYPEILSQAIAAHDGFKKAGSRARTSDGMLLGIKKLKVTGSAHIGDRLRVEVTKEAMFGQFGIIRGEVFNGDRMIASGEIKVWKGDKADLNMDMN